jgi:hypothetical protein
MTIKDFFSFSKNKYFWLNILGMILFIVIAIYATMKGLDIYTQHGKGVPVPNVKGMQLDEAEMLLRNQDLDIVVIDSSYISEYPSGAIVEQNPNVGSRVKKDRLIYVTINSSNAPQRAIPDVIDNCSLREAQAKIGAAGFILGENEYIQGEKDWVYGIKYRGRQLASGEKVPIGATLILVVGDDKFFMPETELDSLNHIIDNNHKKEEEVVVDDSWF